MDITLKAWLVDNPLTTDNKEDQLLQPETPGNLTMKDVIDEMRREDTGLRQETIEHVTNLYHRVVARLAVSGYNINTGLCYISPQIKGAVLQGKWDSEKNSIYIHFEQGAVVRQAAAQTRVQILGEKANAMYIAGGMDAATRAEDATCTAGRNYVINGRMLKIAGTDPAVGVALVPSTGEAIKLSPDMIVVNNPTQLIVLLPADLADGVYELRITTQFCGGNKLLKTPRTVSKILTVGSGGDGGGEVEDPTA